jgi:hypothetical protein
LKENWILRKIRKNIRKERTSVHLKFPRTQAMGLSGYRMLITSNFSTCIKGPWMSYAIFPSNKEMVKNVTPDFPDAVSKEREKRKLFLFLDP